MLNLRQSDLDVARDLFGRERWLLHGLAEQIERLTQVSLGHIDIDDEARLADSGSERNSLALQQFCKLLSRMPCRPLIEGPRHDRGDTFALPWLAIKRHRHGEAHRDDVLAGDVVADHSQPVGEPGTLSLRERPRPGCAHQGALDHALMLAHWASRFALR